MKSTHFVIEGPWEGRLAITPRPRGGDWLEDEIADWKSAGLDVVISALTPEENDSLNLDGESAALQTTGMEAISFPIEDRGIPASFGASDAFFSRVARLLNEGKHVGVHCRQGIGRSSLIAATLLILAGIAPEEAWHRIEVARGCPVPDTPEQKAWVERFIHAAEPHGIED